MSAFSGFTLDRPARVYTALAAVFLTALVVAEATASKFFTLFDLSSPVTILGQRFDAVVMTAGVIAFPITFIVTDLINEYFGQKGIRYVTLLGMAMIVFEYVLFQIGMATTAASFSPVSDDAFRMVFGSSSRIIFGSLTAYVIGQFVDIALFHALRRATHGRHLWLRATGSTLGSQFLDTFAVLSVAFYGQQTWGAIVAITLFNYAYKVVIAIGITPLIYAAHTAIDRYLGPEKAAVLEAEAEAAE